MHKLFNTVDYTVPQLILFGIAAAYWVWVYIVVIRDIIKNKFVGIPVLAVCSNISWEFLWSFVFYTNMGALFEWGYRAWFILDVFIFYSILRYGKMQFTDPALKKYFVDNPRNKGIFLETAHPIKFYEVVESLVNQSIPLPPGGQARRDKRKGSTKIANDYRELKDYLMQ